MTAVTYTDITSDAAFEAMMAKMDAIIADKPAARKTGKAVRFFSGTDTAGVGVEVAERDDGAFFYRTYQWNGYGIAGSKWKELHNPCFETHGENRYTFEKYEYETPRLFWGFTPLAELAEVPKVRLPKA